MREYNVYDRANEIVVMKNNVNFTRVVCVKSVMRFVPDYRCFDDASVISSAVVVFCIFA